VTWLVRSGRGAQVTVSLLYASGATHAMIDREPYVLVISMHGTPRGARRSRWWDLLVSNHQGTYIS
jgi:hypothetical protein